MACLTNKDVVEVLLWDFCGLAFLRSLAASTQYLRSLSLGPLNCCEGMWPLGHRHAGHSEGCCSGGQSQLSQPSIHPTRSHLGPSKLPLSALYPCHVKQKRSAKPYLNSWPSKWNGCFKPFKFTLGFRAVTAVPCYPDGLVLLSVPRSFYFSLLLLLSCHM